MRVSWENKLNIPLAGSLTTRDAISALCSQLKINPATDPRTLALAPSESQNGSIIPMDKKLSEYKLASDYVYELWRGKVLYPIVIVLLNIEYV